MTDCSRREKAAPLGRSGAVRTTHDESNLIIVAACYRRVSVRAKPQAKTRRRKAPSSVTDQWQAVAMGARHGAGNQREDVMRAMAIALIALLSTTGARASATPGDAANPRTIQVAESNTKSPNKLADKYLSGRSGGRYGIGGTESKIFKKKK